MTLALDTETAWLGSEAHMREGNPVPPLACVQIAWGPDPARDVEVLPIGTDPGALRVAAEALLAGCALANAPFDLAVLSEQDDTIAELLWRALETNPELGFRSPGLVYDVLTREKLLDLANGNGLKRRYGLDAVANRRLGWPVWDSPWRRKFYTLRDTPASAWPADALEYAQKDAAATWALKEAQDSAAAAFHASTGLQPLTDAHRQARAHWALHLSSLHGVRTDPEAVAALDAKLQKELQRCMDILQPLDLVRDNGVRNTVAAQQLMDDYCRSLGKAAPLTKGGTKPRKDGSYSPPKVQLSEAALASLDLPPLDKDGNGHPLRIYERYGSVMGLRSRELRPLRQQVIRTRYSELQENGRTSSSGSKEDSYEDEETGDRVKAQKYGKNLQNTARGDNEFEKGFRECLIPRACAEHERLAYKDRPKTCPECRVFVAGDWSKMELSTIAQVLITLFGEDSPTAELARQIRAGVDPHAAIGHKLMPDAPKRGRQCGKPFNFGKWGGMGDAAFKSYVTQYGIKVVADRELQRYSSLYGDSLILLTDTQCEGFSREWAQMYSPWQYFDWINKYAEDGIVQFVSERVRGAPSNGWSFYTAACNGVWSGLAADIAKDTLWNLCKEIYGAPDVGCTSSLYDARQVLFIHDENVLEPKRRNADACAARLQELMQDVFTLWCPDVPCAADVRILEAGYNKG
jgi:hypothetical protein